MRLRSKRAMLLAVLSALSMLLGATPLYAQTGELSVPADAAAEIAANKVESTYLVMMAGDPAASYTGDVAGYAATKPAEGEKLDAEDTDVRRYRDYLRSRGNSAMRNAGISTSRKVYDYGLTFNGFSARLTGVEASALAQQPNVIAVVEDELRQLDTISTPDFLGLTAEGGAWDSGYKGQNVVVGVLDSGLWPENPSFQPTGGRYGRLARWAGECVTGDGWDASDCNRKVIGARYYNAGWGGDAGVTAAFPYEYNSARDADGHGSHTASTAAGAADVPVVVDGQALGTASGMAPLARIAVYKVCWGRSPEGGCFGADSVAAVEDAVADGVDVINFSISGTSSNFLDPVEIAFLGAADAGVFVAASAGNDGPGASTLNHPSPWIMTVAASTHDRYSEATLTLGNGSTYTSASFQTSGTDNLALVYAGDVVAPGADAGDAALCVPGSLDPALVEGKMVLCERGVIARVDKSLAVRDAGGAAMVMGNTSPNSINGDIHFVPSIHVDEVAFAEILAYIGSAGAGATGQLSPGQEVVDETAPQVAEFSSRGPSLGSGDILKPDITAPGVDVLAAYTPDVYGRDFDLLSGTSMSSPHIAGLAAVIKSAYRGWTPDMIKSALMTTAYSVDGATPFDVGSGHADPNSALDPGLVYKANFNQYVGFLCGTGQLDTSVCTDVFGVRVLDPSNLNQPNIAVGELAGTQTVTRRVTNVTGKTTTFRVSVDAPPGVDVTVSPSRITLQKGKSATYTVTFTVDDAPLGEYAFGSLTWASNRGHEVTSQLVVQPVQLAAPTEVTGTGTEGSIDYDVTFGYDGAFTAAPHGLVPANTQEGNVVDDPANDINTALDTGVGYTLHEIEVPDGTAYTRVSLFDEYTDGEDDMDLYVFDADFNFVGGSGSGTSAEQVDLVLPAAGTYYVIVHGWQTDGPDANYTLFDWSVSATPADGSGATDLSLTAPTSASLGDSGTVSVSWDGLDAGTKYLGAVSYTDTGLFGLTVVSVATD